jgi:hypothetical protein
MPHAPRHGELVDATRLVAQTLRTPRPTFHYRILWATTYEALFAGNTVGATGIDAALDVARTRGRVILSSEGGTGKSVILQLMFKRAVELEMQPVLLDLKHWTPPMFETWEAFEDSDVSRMSLLFEHLAQPAVSEAELAHVDASIFRPLLVDGLNELPRGLGDQILLTLDAFCQRNPGAGAIVADRLVRRAFPGRVWEIATIAPFDQAEIDALLPDAQPERRANVLLRRAFYLDLAVKQGIDALEGAGPFEDYFRRHVGLSAYALNAAATAAYETYRVEAARTFALDTFEQVAGAGTTDVLRNANILVSRDGRWYFVHHLYHDYLTSRHLAAHRRLWGSAAFDVVSFDATSFDALALALQQIKQTDDADAFLAHMYDWNFYASAYALAKGRALGEVAVSADMEIALLAMLAERRWDPLDATAQAVADALRLIPGQLAADFLNAPDLASVQALVAQLDVKRPEVLAWRSLFLKAEGASATAETLTALGGDQSLIGWTASNVLRRSALSPDQAEELRRYLASERPTIRWRAAHALAAHPSPATVDALVERLHDDDQWVRYGSIRALIEIAALSEELRGPTVEKLRENATLLQENPYVRREFTRAVILRDPPSGWARAIEPLIEQLWVAAPSPSAHDHWRQLAYDIERSVERVA